MGPKKPNTCQGFKLLVAHCELPMADLSTLSDVLGKCALKKNKLANNARFLEVLPGIVQAIK